MCFASVPACALECVCVARVYGRVCPTRHVCERPCVCVAERVRVYFGCVFVYYQACQRVCERHLSGQASLNLALAIVLPGGLKPPSA